MCLAIPCKVTQLLDHDMASLQVGDSETFIKACLMLLPETPEPGDYVLVHAGFAINTVERDEARKTIDLIREMAIAAGEQPLFNTAFDL